MQSRVKTAFDKLRTPQWHVLDASQSIDTLHQQIITITQQVMEKVKDQPIGVIS